MARILDAERKTLRRNLPKLLETARDRLVLIHGSMVTGAYPVRSTSIR